MLYEVITGYLPVGLEAETDDGILELGQGEDIANHILVTYQDVGPVGIELVPELHQVVIVERAGNIGIDYGGRIGVAVAINYGIHHQGGLVGLQAISNVP